MGIGNQTGFILPDAVSYGLNHKSKRLKKNKCYYGSNNVIEGMAHAVRFAEIEVPILESCAVMHVPILSPRVRPRADSKLIRPVLKSTMVRPTVALLL